MIKNILLCGFIVLIYKCNGQENNNRIVFKNCNELIEQHYLSLPSTKLFYYEEVKDLKNKDSIYYLVINYKECAAKDYYNELKEFKNIEIVSLIGNFQSIPKQLLFIKKIQRLNISFNNSGCFDEIFMEASRFSNLKTLKISNSYLGTLPESIKNLKKIENFHVQNSEISDFGDYFSELKNLKTLAIENCGLCSLPSDYINPNLVCLDISGNRFNDLPVEIINFENLTVFRYLYNFTSISNLKIFCSLKNLEYLYLGYIEAESVPNELLCVENLEFLFLSNPIYDFDNILNFSRLKVIDISDFRGEQAKLNEFRNLTKIQIIAFPSIKQ